MVTLVFSVRLPQVSEHLLLFRNRGNIASRYTVPMVFPLLYVSSALSDCNHGTARARRETSARGARVRAHTAFWGCSVSRTCLGALRLGSFCRRSDRSTPAPRKETGRHSSTPRPAKPHRTGSENHRRPPCGTLHQLRRSPRGPRLRA